MLVYVDNSEVREGALDQIEEAIEELARFIEANVPHVLAYNVYLSEDGGQMTVVHVHADPSSLDEHLETGGPVFRRFADLLTLKSIHVYGEPSAKAMGLLREKASALGSGEVFVHSPKAGFSRL
jgi:antibiotic biosynthesis monooxygenase